MIPYDVKIGQRYLCDFRHGSTEIHSDPALIREIKDMPLYHFPYMWKTVEHIALKYCTTKI